MGSYEIEEVLEYARDLKREYLDKDDIEAFNQAIMRLRSAVSDIYVIEEFEEIKEME